MKRSVFLAIGLVLCTVAYGLSEVPRVKTWGFKERLTSSDLNTEFQNLSDNAASLTGSETLTNKTLTNPTINTGTLNTSTLNTPTLNTPVIDTSVSGTAFSNDSTFSNTTSNQFASTLAIKAYVDTHAGTLIKRSLGIFNHVSSGTANIPLDDSKPQSSEGNSWFSFPYTPREVGSTIVVKTTTYVGASSGNTASVAIFKNSDTDAIGAGSSFGASSPGVPGQVSAIASFGPITSLSIKTLHVRGSIGTTTYLNANSSGTRQFGGVLNSYIEVDEY